MANFYLPLSATTSLRDFSDEKLGFEGLVITDDLEMGAILRSYSIADACIMALNAGNDMLAICAGQDSIRSGHAAVLRSVESGEIAEDRIDASLERIAASRSRIPIHDRFDPDATAAIRSKVEQFAVTLENNLED